MKELLSFDVILVMLIVAISASLVSVMITRKISSKKEYQMIKNQAMLDSQQEYSATYEECLNKIKTSEEYQALLEREYLHGKADGAQSTIAKFVLSYEPFIEIEDNWWKKKATSGYQLQIYYEGLPVGDATRRIVQKEEKYNEANYKNMVEFVLKILSCIAAAVSPTGIPIKIIEEVLVEKKHKEHGGPGNLT